MTGQRRDCVALCFVTWARMDAHSQHPFPMCLIRRRVPCWGLPVGLCWDWACGGDFSQVGLGEWASVQLSVTSVPTPMATLSTSPWGGGGGGWGEGLTGVHRMGRPPTLIITLLVCRGPPLVAFSWDTGVPPQTSFSTDVCPRVTSLSLSRSFRVPGRPVGPQARARESANDGTSGPFSFQAEHTAGAWSDVLPTGTIYRHRPSETSQRGSLWLQLPTLGGASGCVEPAGS